MDHLIHMRVTTFLFDFTFLIISSFNKCLVTKIQDR